MAKSAFRPLLLPFQMTFLGVSFFHLAPKIALLLDEVTESTYFEPISESLWGSLLHVGLPLYGALAGYHGYFSFKNLVDIRDEYRRRLGNDIDEVEIPGGIWTDMARAFLHTICTVTSSVGVLFLAVLITIVSFLTDWLWGILVMFIVFSLVKPISEFLIHIVNEIFSVTLMDNDLDCED